MKRTVSTQKKTLHACTMCNKIALDGGGWLDDKYELKNQPRYKVIYGVCPDCSHRLYPNLYKTPLKELYGG